jgi:ribose 5-phosphate isomerase B
MKIALGADHRGVELKEKVKKYLKEKGHAVLDLGTNSKESVDYPDFGFKVSESVAQGENDRGILFCWSGIGMCIAANKVKGIRAALCLNPTMAELSRQHNDANILCLSTRFTPEDGALKIIDVWLSTEFEEGRHKRRVDKINRYEGSGL